MKIKFCNRFGITQLMLMQSGFFLAVFLFYYGVYVVPASFRLRGDAWQYFSIAEQFHSFKDAFLYTGDRSAGLPWYNYLIMRLSSAKNTEMMVNHICISLFLLHECCVFLLGWVISKKNMFHGHRWFEGLFIALLAGYPALVMHTTTPLTDTLTTDVLILVFVLLSLSEDEPYGYKKLIMSVMAGVLSAYTILLRPACWPAVSGCLFTYGFMHGLMVIKASEKRINLMILLGVLSGFMLLIVPVLMHCKAHYGHYCLQNSDTFSIVGSIQAGLMGGRLLWFMQPTQMSFLPVLPDPFMMQQFYTRCAITSISGITETSLTGCLLQHPLDSLIFMAKKWIGLFDAFRLTPYTETITPVWYVWISRAFGLCAFSGFGFMMIQGLKCCWAYIRDRKYPEPLYAATWCFSVILLMTHTIFHVEERYILPCIPLCLFMFVYWYYLAAIRSRQRLRSICIWIVYCTLLSCCFMQQVHDWDLRYPF